ncbi:MAG: hypothetical protein AAF184_16615 [Pseudomonadota bacterium]
MKQAMLITVALFVAPSLAQADCPQGGSTVSEGQGRTPAVAEAECTGGLQANASATCGSCTVLWISQQIDHFRGFGGGYKMECSGTFACESQGHQAPTPLLQP